GLFDELFECLQAACVEQKHEPQTQYDDLRRLADTTKGIEQFTCDAEEERAGDAEYLDTLGQGVTLVNILGIKVGVLPAVAIDRDRFRHARHEQQRCERYADPDRDSE